MPAWRARQAARWEAAVAARLPLGSDGVVRGAEPIVLDATGDRGALVLHGFGDTPESVATVAHALHARGWSVEAPLLPGHGRDLRTFAGSRAEDWLAGARAAYAALRARRTHVVLVAQSMGAALAAVLAADAERAGAPPPALVLLAPYLDLPASVRWGARLAPLLALGTPYLSSDGGARSLHDDEARAVSLGPKVVTPWLVRELARVVAWGQAALPGGRCTDADRGVAAGQPDLTAGRHGHGGTARAGGSRCAAAGDRVVGELRACDRGGSGAAGGGEAGGGVGGPVSASVSRAHASG